MKTLKFRNITLLITIAITAGFLYYASVFAADITAVWSTDSPVIGAPAVGDLDDDGDLEVIVCSENGKVYVWRHDGTLFNPSWPITISNSMIAASPTIADIDLDGNLEIIVMSSKNMGSYYKGNLYVYRPDGTVVFGPKSMTYSGAGSPAVADFDPSYPGLEIAAVDCAGILQGSDYVYVWHCDGTNMSGWPKSHLSTANSSTPTFADFDGNKSNGLELVVCKGLNDITVWRSDGTTVLGFPANSNTHNMWSMITGDSPAVADLDGNAANGPEVVISGGRTLPGSVYEYRIYAWHNDGSTVSGWSYKTTEACYTPVIADINNNNTLEVIASSQQKIYILNRDGTLLRSWSCAGASSPAIADIDGDGEVEIIVNGADEKIHAWHADGTAVSGWPKNDGNNIDAVTICSSAIIADLDDDDTLEVIVGSSDSHVYVFSCPDEVSGTRRPWAAFRGNIERTAFYERLYSIYGHIRRYGINEGINGIKVTITGDGAPITIETRDDKQGNPGYYEKEDLKGGTYNIEASNAD